mmetsp:Transcript_91909/g.259625  ORF Transcript_91909/g.259625 Transcript_91909/m.259625 type:complete len:221 (+) Transcript_91909:906-1568(+)
MSPPSLLEPGFRPRRRPRRLCLSSTRACCHLHCCLPGTRRLWGTTARKSLDRSGHGAPAPRPCPSQRPLRVPLLAPPRRGRRRQPAGKRREAGKVRLRCCSPTSPANRGSGASGERARRWPAMAPPAWTPILQWRVGPGSDPWADQVLAQQHMGPGHAPWPCLALARGFWPCNETRDSLRRCPWESSDGHRDLPCPACRAWRSPGLRRRARGSGQPVQRR